MDGERGSAPVGLAGTSTEVLEHECTTLAAQVASLTCRFLVVVGELDRRGAWERWWGCKSMAHWLAWRCSLSQRAAQEHLRVARALADLPVTTEAFGRGELSYSKVRALVRVATPDGEAELVALARTATAAQLEAIIRATVAATRDPRRHTELRELHLGVDGEGLGTVRARMPADAHVIVAAAIDDAMACMPDDDDDCGGQGCDRCTAAHRVEAVARRRADALVRICEAWLAGDRAARPGSERNQVVVHVDVAAEGGVGRSETEAGLPLHPETGLRLSCDATAQAILGHEGVPLGAGRRSRTIPRRLRRAMRRHTGGVCEWAGCQERRWTEIHHLLHWAHGGETEWSNLAWLCWFHHRKAHEGGWRLQRDPSAGLRSYRPDGTELVDPAPRSAPPSPSAIVIADPEVIVPRWAGERFDLGACVDTVLHATHQT